MSHLKRSVR